MIAGVTSSLTYNHDGKLRSGSAASVTVDLKYDPDGNRIYREVDNGQTTTKRKYIVDTEGDLPVVLLEIDPDVSDPNGCIVKTYLYTGTDTIAQHDGFYADDKYFYLSDRIGSVRQVIDVNASVEHLYSYGPFGKRLEADSDPDPVTNRLGFTGQYFDEELDQYHLRARQYIIALYRFSTRDPYEGSLWCPLELHRYLYCLNDPLNRADLSGRQSLIETQEEVGGQATLNAGVNGALNYGKLKTRYQLFGALVSLRNSMMNMLPAAAQNNIEAFTRYMNQLGYQVHHIVGRGWNNMATYGRDTIHSLVNVVPLRPEMHTQITSFFNSGPNTLTFMERMGIGGGTLQQYVAGLSLAEQAQWGAAALQHLFAYNSMAGFQPAMYGL